MADSNDDDDPIVAQLPVYAAQHLNDKLYAFWYPLRPADRPYEADVTNVLVTAGILPDAPTTAPSSSSSKPLGPHARFILSHEIENVPFYSNFKQEDDDDDGTRGFQDHRYELISSPARLHTNHTMMLIQDGEVHLTTMAGVHQFRPLRHGVGAPAMGAGGQGDSETYLSQLNVDEEMTLSMKTYLQKQLDRMRSYAEVQDFGSARRGDYYPRGSVESISMAKKLLCLNTDATAPDIGKSSTYFMLDLGADESFRIRAPALRFAPQTLPLDEHISYLIRSSKCLGLCQLMQLIRKDPTSEVDVKVTLTSLKKSAVYAHGVWMSTFDSNFRIYAALREYIIYCFAQGKDGVVKSEDFLADPLPPSLWRAVKGIICSLATKIENRQWRLRNRSTDEEKFMQTCAAQEVQSQLAFWQRVGSELVNAWNALKSGKGVKTLQLYQPLQPTYGSRTPTSRASFGMSSMLGGFPASPAPNTTLATQGNAADIASSPQFDAAKRFIVLCFQYHGVINKQLMKEHVKKQIENPLSIVSGVQPAVLQAAMKDLLTGFTEATWVLKSTGAPGIDACRPAIMNFLVQNRCATKQQIQQGAEATLQKPITAGIVQTVVQELCTWSQGETLWHVKTGNVTWGPIPGTLKKS